MDRDIVLHPLRPAPACHRSDSSAFGGTASAASDGAAVLGGWMGEQIVAGNALFRGIAGEEARRIEIESLRNEVSDDPMGDFHCAMRRWEQKKLRSAQAL